MKNEIIIHLDDPRQLEKLYRENKTAFKKEFHLLYPKLSDNKLADFWNERLHYESSEISWGSTKELTFVIIISLIAGVIAKFPALFNLNPEFFYPRNAGFIVFPILTTYFIWKKQLSANKLFIAGIVFLLAAIFINVLPADDKSDTLILSCIHLPLLLWSVLGFTYVGDNTRNLEKRLEFLRYNGDLLIMSGLILIAGGMLTAITLALFSVIGYNIEQFFIENIVLFCLPAIPILGTFITQSNPQLVNKVSPVIAKIFSPLVLITLVVYLGAILYSGKDPYNDRKFLMIFNLLLIGVMSIILFSVAGSAKESENRTSNYILFALSSVTIIVNGIALSAILFRISEWGITPNRLAVLGGNILMLTNLLMVTFRLYKSVSKREDINEVENSISKFLPIYVVWTIVVIFLFPLLFQFK